MLYSQTYLLLVHSVSIQELVMPRVVARLASHRGAHPVLTRISRSIRAFTFTRRQYHDGRGLEQLGGVTSSRRAAQHATAPRRAR